MRMILIGCEYAGTTTLAHAINDWAEAHLGARFNNIHDHFKIPHVSGHPPDLTSEEQEQYLALSPKIKEMAQRHNVVYHTPTKPNSEGGHLVIGLHIEELIYGPMYFGYGCEDAPGDRNMLARQTEHKIMTHAPETALVLVKASAEVIAKRMKEHPHHNGVVSEKDIEAVLWRFEEEFARSMIRNKLEVDTGTATVEETLADFVRKMEPFMTSEDPVRMAGHKALQGLG